MFRNRGPVRDESKTFVVMTSTLEEYSLVGVAFTSAAELCSENHCSGHKPLNGLRVVKCKLHTPGARRLLLMKGKLTVGSLKSSCLL